MIVPPPEPVAESMSSGDCERVKVVVGDHETDCGALVIVNVTKVDVTEYKTFAGAVAVISHVPGAVKEMTADNALTVQPESPAELTE